jgi:hypothetical protein
MGRLARLQPMNTKGHAICSVPIHGCVYVRVMADNALVTRPCRECRSSSVELLKVVHDKRVFWCRQCSAVWFASKREGDDSVAASPTRWWSFLHRMVRSR